MKLSTKLLAGTILIIILVIISHYVALYSMEQSGKYTTVDSFATEGNAIVTHEDMAAEYPKGVAQVNVEGFANLTIIMSDSFYFEYLSEENPDNTAWVDGEETRRWVRFPFWKQEGSALHLNGDTTYYDTIYQDHVEKRSVRSYNVLRLHVTGKEKVLARNCNISLEAGKKPLKLDIQLDSTDFEGFDTHGSNTAYDIYYSIDELSVAARNDSKIHLKQAEKIRMLNAYVGEDCYFWDYGTPIQSGTITCHDEGNLDISGINVENLRFRRDPGGKPGKPEPAKL